MSLEMECKALREVLEIQAHTCLCCTRGAPARPSFHAFQRHSVISAALI